MLRFLSIRHLAVIDRLELEFEPGLNVLTGETGAGKSILVGAIGLLVGGRASADLVRTGEEAAALEAIFEAADGREILLRREITAQGRSRAFIGGALATSAALRELSTALVDLHGQHEHQLLLDPSAHLDLLDAFAGVEAERAAAASAFGEWQQIRDERNRLIAVQKEGTARAEFLTFQLTEIDRVAPKEGEDEELTAQRVVLANADKLQRLSTDAYQALYEGESAALPALGVVWRRLTDLATIDERFAVHLAARDAVKSQLEDLAYFLRSYASTLEASPARLQEVEDRLALLERLKKKYGPTLGDVLSKRQQIKDDLDLVEHGTERMAEIDNALQGTRAAYVAAAGVLTRKRMTAGDKFSRSLEKTLEDLAMARTRCDVRFSPATGEAEWSERGVEQAEFYISPNPGEDLKPLARIASGGELSRIMLALKTLATTDAPGKTLIFDEVDAGIGGAVADVVGERLQTLARRCQVLCITHLPQIAAHGSTHFRITKNIRQGRTVTEVARLAPREREEELARMIGGAEVSATVLAGAREMLSTRSGEAKTGKTSTKASSFSGAKGEAKPKGERRNRGSDGTRIDADK
jgi:DNA repair protein RecN (Recombination protein N)